ncbi:MAG: signal peptidase I [Actinomycetota bacterium]|nr:signal peptidase I [Actinomycetota bacterium]
MQEPQFSDGGYDSAPGRGGQTSPPAKEKESFLSFLGELPVLIITAIVVAWLIKTFLVQPFFIPSSSMEPTLLPGDRVLVSKLSYRFGSPQPGNIVVFIAPQIAKGSETDYIKRIMATPGMKVQEINGRMAVNGRPKNEPYTRADNPSASFGPATVPPGKVFVMGDNRGNSRDSRYFGPIDKKSLVGKAFFVYWPPSRMGMLK